MLKPLSQRDWKDKKSSSPEDNNAFGRKINFFF